jgi:hypothetical protein
LNTPSAPIVSVNSPTSINVNEATSDPLASSYSINVYASNGTTLLSTTSVATATITSITILTGLNPNTSYQISVNEVGDGINYVNSAQSSLVAVTTTMGVSSVSLATSDGSSSVQFQKNIIIVATVSPTAGLLTINYNGRPIFRCSKITISSSNFNCTWKASAHGSAVISASFIPTNVNYLSSTAAILQLNVSSRTSTHG